MSRNVIRLKRFALIITCVEYTYAVVFVEVGSISIGEKESGLIQSEREREVEEAAQDLSVDPTKEGSTSPLLRPRA